VPHQDRSNSHRPNFPPNPYGASEPHDVLAAEEFGIGGRDERFPPDPLGVADPHDTLAAEEFIIGTRDDRWPRDPSGYYEPHDVLAAEAFPMPLPDAGGAHSTADSPRSLIRLTVALAALGTAAVLLRRR
jgi:hypothetical protein